MARIATSKAASSGTVAEAINNRGRITGQAIIYQTNESQAFLMGFTSAVPEPSTYALMLTGLVVLRHVSNRRVRPAVMQPASTPGRQWIGANIAAATYQCGEPCATL